MVPLAIALALAVLSHNVCAMFAMGLVVLLPPALLLVMAAENGRAGAMVRCLPRYALAVAWGLGLAAFFWVPAIVEMRSTRAFGIFHEHGLTFMEMPVFLGLDFFAVPTGGQFPRHLGWILVPAVLSGLVATVTSTATVRRVCLVLLASLAASRVDAAAAERVVLACGAADAGGAVCVSSADDFHAAGVPADPGGVCHGWNEPPMGDGGSVGGTGGSRRPEYSGTTRWHSRGRCPAPKRSGMGRC